MITVEASIRHNEAEKWQADFRDAVEVQRTGVKVVVLGKAVDTSAVQLSLADLTAPSYAFVKNIGASGEIEFGLYSGSLQACMRLQPGQFAVFPVKPGITLGAQGSQAGCQLLLQVYEA